MVMAEHFFVVSLALFCVGLLGWFWAARSTLSGIFSLLLMTLAPILNFLVFSRRHGDEGGQIFSLLILAASAGQILVGLSLAVFQKNFKKGPMSEAPIEGE